MVLDSGLDNAGKTTILKKLKGEDISSISPTLGFNIKTIIRDGWVLSRSAEIRARWVPRQGIYRDNVQLCTNLST